MARASRLDEVAQRYERGETQQAIADGLGKSITTINRDIAWLQRAGRIERRSAGEAISRGLRAYRQTDAGMAQTAAQTTVERVTLNCEWCGAAFLRTRTELRHSACRFCSQRCTHQWLWNGPGADGRRTAGLSGLKHRRTSETEERTARGVMFLDGALKLLPRRLRRSRISVNRHIKAGGLVAVGHDSRGRSLYDRDGIATYRGWLENHPDPRVRR